MASEVKAISLAQPWLENDRNRTAVARTAGGGWRDVPEAALPVWLGVAVGMADEILSLDDSVCRGGDVR